MTTEQAFLSLSSLELTDDEVRSVLARYQRPRPRRALAAGLAFAAALLIGRRSPEPSGAGGRAARRAPRRLRAGQNGARVGAARLAAPGPVRGRRRAARARRGGRRAHARLPAAERDALLRLRRRRHLRLAGGTPLRGRAGGPLRPDRPHDGRFRPGASHWRPSSGSRCDSPTALRPACSRTAPSESLSNQRAARRNSSPTARTAAGWPRSISRSAGSTGQRSEPPVGGGRRQPFGIELHAGLPTDAQTVDQAMARDCVEPCKRGSLSIEARLPERGDRRLEHLLGQVLCFLPRR